MSAPQFLRPDWLVLAPVALLWIALFWLHRRADGGWGGFVDAHLLQPMLAKRSGGSLSAVLMLLLLGLICVVALSGPSWTKTEVPVDREGRVRVFVLDMSRSMAATDLRPSRMAQARLKLLDLLEQSRDRPVALIGFGAYPYTLTPVTDDTSTLTHMVPLITPHMVPAQGADVDGALARAEEVIAQAYARAGDVVLISDSAASDAAVARAASMARNGVSVSVVSVGTESTVTVPIGQSVLRDAAGAPVSVDPAHDSLAALARAGGGRVVRLDHGAVAVESVLSAAGASAAGNREANTATLWRDDGAWLLWLALLPVCALARRGVVV
ncbi:MAG: VWA domain-containing protein [Pseudomonadota bacterium]